MEQEEIQRRNEAIAVFMGWIVDPSYFFWHNHGIDKKHILLYCNGQGYLYDLHFHEDYNWLMTVAQKTSNIKGVFIKIWGELGSYECTIDFLQPNELSPIFYQSTTSLIEAIFLAVSDFCLTQNK